MVVPRVLTCHGLLSGVLEVASGTNLKSIQPNDLMDGKKVPSWASSLYVTPPTLIHPRNAQPGRSAGGQVAQSEGPHKTRAHLQDGRLVMHVAWP